MHSLASLSDPESKEAHWSVSSAEAEIGLRRKSRPEERPGIISFAGVRSDAHFGGWHTPRIALQRVAELGAQRSLFASSGIKVFDQPHVGFGFIQGQDELAPVAAYAGA